MKIAISGASGFIGRHLTEHLLTEGHEVVALGRGDFEEEVRDRLAYLVAECDAVVNLAGAPLDKRWSRDYRRQLVESRLETTRRLVDAVNRSEHTKTFLSASAVGLYPAVGCYDEYSDERGTGFLSDLCQRWEAEARQVRVRCLRMRFGVVFGADGGAFPALAAPVRHGVAVVPGGGSQPFSWIGITDLVRAVEFLITHPKLAGAFNLTTPENVSMREIVRAVAKHYGTRLVATVPAFALRMLRGEAASVMLDGRCAVPLRLLEAGFRFETPTVEEFLRRL